MDCSDLSQALNQLYQGQQDLQEKIIEFIEKLKNLKELTQKHDFRKISSGSS